MKLLLCLLTSGVVCFAGAFGEDLKSYVQKVNGETARAYKTKDSKFFDHLFCRNFKAKDERGVILGRKEALFGVRFQLNTVKVLDYRMSTQSIKLEKAQGVVVSQSKLLGLSTPRRGQPPEKVQIIRRWSDLYQKQGSGWALVYRTELAAPLMKVTPMTALIPPRSGKSGKAKP